MTRKHNAVAQKTSNANPRHPVTSKSMKANAGPKVMQRILKRNPRKVTIYENKPRSAARGKRCYWKNQEMLLCYFINFDDGIWRQAEAWIVFLAGAIDVNALAQGALRQFTQWLWMDHPTFQLRGRHLSTELLPPQSRLVYYKGHTCVFGKRVGI